VLLHQQTKDTQPTLSQSFDPSIPPANIFRIMDPPMYRSFDAETGLPLTDLLDVPLSKSSFKKVRKIQDLHQKRHQKWLNQERTKVPTESRTSVLTDCSGTDNVETNQTPVEPTSLPAVDWKSKLDTSFCMVVAGTFGKRQGFEFQSDMGPFCHVVQI
jgi:hypothetical protein